MNQHEERIAALKISAATGGATVSALTLNEWVAIATLIFILLQIGLLIPKYVVMYQRWRKGEPLHKRHDDPTP